MDLCLPFCAGYVGLLEKGKEETLLGQTELQCQAMLFGQTKRTLLEINVIVLFA